MMTRKYMFLYLLVLFLFSKPVIAQWHTFNSVAMTTPISLVLWDKDIKNANKVSQMVFAEFDRIEQQMSRYIESSELSLINRNAYEKPVVVSSSLYTVLKTAMNISHLSEGAFDITFASVGFMYDFRKKLQPEKTDLESSLDLFHFQNVLLDDEKQTIKFKKKGILIDLGGIAKGFAVDQGMAILKKQNVQFAHLSAGGDMRLLGDKKGAPWIIGIRNPRDESKQSIVLPLINTAISTSGDYERFFMDENGERIHHILSPKTGKPVKGMMSVTVLANDAITSDGLSTAVFVLGLKKGLALINKLNGIDAILIDELGETHYSEGLMRPPVN